MLNKRAGELGWKTGDYLDAREWIIKDYMIAMTAIVKNADVILTADKKTFYPLCQDVENTNCILTYPQLFREEGIYILEYDYKNVDNFVSKIPFTTLNEIELAKPPSPIQQSLFTSPIDANDPRDSTSGDGIENTVVDQNEETEHERLVIQNTFCTPSLPNKSESITEDVKRKA